MLSDRLTTAATVALATAALGVGAFTAASPAAASGSDDTFFTQMTAVGVSFSSPLEAVRVGHQVCTELRAGEAEADIALELRAQRSLTPKQAAYLIVDASNIYCSRLASQLA